MDPKSGPPLLQAAHMRTWRKEGLILPTCPMLAGYICPAAKVSFLGGRTQFFRTPSQMRAAAETSCPVDRTPGSLASCQESALIVSFATQHLYFQLVAPVDPYVLLPLVVCFQNTCLSQQLESLSLCFLLKVCISWFKLRPVFHFEIFFCGSVNFKVPFFVNLASSQTTEKETIRLIKQV